MHFKNFILGRINAFGEENEQKRQVGGRESHVRKAWEAFAPITLGQEGKVFWEKRESWPKGATFRKTCKSYLVNTCN